MFVNVPIGVAVVVAAPIVLAETRTRRGRLDLSGAVTATAGMTLLVYGFIHAATTSWGDRWTVACLVAGGVVLFCFLLLEARSRHALMPLHIFRSRNRSATYAIVLAVGTAIFSMFYFGTLFMQDVLGFGPLRAGVAYLAPSVTVVVLAGITSLLMGRVRTKTLLVVGCALAAAGLGWFSTVGADSTYVHGLLGPLLVTAAGMGVCFVPLTSGAIAGVAPNEEGIASALLNAGQQIGGTLGLAILGSVAAGITRSRLADALRSLGVPGGGPVTSALGPAPGGHGAAVSPAVHHVMAGALVSGYTTAFAAGAGIMVFALVLSAVALDGRIPAVASGRPGLPG
jgi:predicted MFS family arabinose efflux permease